MKLRNLFYVLAAAVCLTAVSCKDEPKEPVKDEATLTVAPSSLSITPAGEEKSLTVTSDTEWTVTVPAEASWLTVNPLKGNGNGTVKVTGTANVGPEGQAASERSATISFAIEGKKVDINVTQSAETIVFIVSGQTADFGADGGKLEVKVEYNETYSIGTLPEWIQQGTKATATDNLEFTVVPNETYEPREATITFTSASGKTGSVKVNQAAAPKPAPGTKDNPYLISTAEDMKNMASKLVAVTSDDAEPVYFKLEENVDMAGIEWTPLNVSGDDNYGKKIDFNGNGKTISNLTCSVQYASFCGILFGEIYDVTFKNAAIAAASSCSGIVAAYGGNDNGFIHSSKVTNVCVSGSVSGGATGVGGIVGRLLKGEVSGCMSAASVSSTQNYCGGIVGYINKGDANDGSKISNCISTGDVKQAAGGKQRYGGIVGGINGQHQIVEYCISTSNVESDTGTGGICGMAHFDSSKAADCLGHDNTVKCCIAWNPVVNAVKCKIANYSPGAVIGYASVDGNYIDCVRRPDMAFTQNTAQTDATNYPVNFIELVDQENSDKDHPLTVGINCDHNTTHVSPYHGKAAASGETASQVAKRLGWDETIWNLSGNIPVLVKFPVSDIPGIGYNDPSITL